MPVLVRIAFRNMWEHKAKSLIIGTLLVLGVLLIIVGNAMMDSAADGLRRGYIESFTGDVMVSAKSDSTFSIFGAESMDMSGDTEIPTIPDYDRIMERLRNDPRVLSVTGMATAYSLLSADREEDVVADSDSDSEGVIFALVFGVDPETYFRTFPAATIEEGRLPEPGEQAVLLTAEMREKLEKKYKHDFKLGDKILINGFSNAGMRIREVSLVGIYKRGEFMEKAPFIITDIDTVRVLSGLTMSADEQVTLSENQTNLLSSVNPDDIFSDDAAGGSMIDAPVAAMDTSKLDSAAGLLGDTSRRELLNAADTGAWHFILVRLNNSIDTAGMMGDLEKWGAAEKVDLRVTDWKGGRRHGGADGGLHPRHLRHRHPRHRDRRGHHHHEHPRHLGHRADGGDRHHARPRRPAVLREADVPYRNPDPDGLFRPARGLPRGARHDGAEPPAHTAREQFRPAPSGREGSPPRSEPRVIDRNIGRSLPCRMAGSSLPGFHRTQGSAGKSHAVGVALWEQFQESRCAT